MKGLSHVCIVFLAVVCACAPSSASGVKTSEGNNKKEQTETLFSRANALENLMAAGTPPYLLRIRVTGMGELSRYPEGSYTVLFLSPSEFREDQKFGQVQFSLGVNGDAKQQWTSSDGNSFGLLERVFMWAISYVYNPTALQSPKANASLTQRVVSGLRANCIEQKKPDYREVCFDAITGFPVAAIDESGFEFQYSDFRHWGSHQVPGTIVAFASNTPVLKATVEALQALPPDQTMVSAFVPPPRAAIAQMGKTCSVAAAQLISRYEPVYPRSAGRPFGDGTVVVVTYIDETGRLPDALVVQSAGPPYDQAALQAVKQWRYTPTMMCGGPVSVTMTIRVQFH